MASRSPPVHASMAATKSANACGSALRSRRAATRTGSEVELKSRCRAKSPSRGRSLPEALGPPSELLSRIIESSARLRRATLAHVIVGGQLLGRHGLLALMGVHLAAFGERCHLALAHYQPTFPPRAIGGIPPPIGCPGWIAAGGAGWDSDWVFP